MYDFKKMDKRLIIYTNIFLMSNRLQTIMDSQIEGVTTKQWLFLIMLGLFEESPQLKETADACSTSHQNAKQIALKLEKKGFVQIEKDERDGRARRIRKTAKGEAILAKIKGQGEQFINEMFRDFEYEEILELNRLMEKLYKTLEEL